MPKTTEHTALPSNARTIVRDFVALMESKQLVSKENANHPLFKFEENFLNNIGKNSEIDRNNHLLYTQGIPLLQKITEHLLTQPSSNRIAEENTLINLINNLNGCGPGVYTRIEEAYVEMLFSNSKDITKILALYRKKIASTVAAEIYQKALSSNEFDRNSLHEGMEIHYVNAMLNTFSAQLQLNMIQDDLMAACDANILAALNQRFLSNRHRCTNTGNLINYLIANFTIDSYSLSTLINQLNQDPFASNALETYGEKFTTPLIQTLNLYGTDIHWFNQKEAHLDYESIIPFESPFQLSWKAPYYLSLSIANRLIASKLLTPPLPTQVEKIPLSENKMLYLPTSDSFHLSVIHQTYGPIPFLVYVAETLLTSENNEERDTLIKLISNRLLTQTQNTEILQVMLDYLSAAQPSADKINADISAFCEKLLVKNPDWHSIINAFAHAHINIQFNQTAIQSLLPTIHSSSQLETLCAFIDKKDALFLFQQLNEHLLKNTQINLNLIELTACAIKNEFNDALTFLLHEIEALNLFIDLKERNQILLNCLIRNKTPLPILFNFITQHGMDIKEFINTIDGNTGHSFISNAIINGQLALCQLLLEMGVIDFTKQYTPAKKSLAHLAIQYQRLDILRLFAQHDIDIDTLDANKSTLLHLAVETKNIDTLKHVLQLGIDATCLNRHNETAFELACNYFPQQTEIMLLLAKERSTLSEEEYLNLIDNLSLLTFFSENKIQLRPKLSDNNNPIQLLFLHECEMTEPLLLFHLEQGADLNQINTFGETALHLATIGSNVNNLKCLLSLKNKPALIGSQIIVPEDIREKNKNLKVSYNNFTPLHLAILHNDEEKCQLLLEAYKDEIDIHQYGNAQNDDHSISLLTLAHIINNPTIILLLKSYQPKNPIMNDLTDTKKRKHPALDETANKAEEIDAKNTTISLTPWLDGLFIPAKKGTPPQSPSASKKTKRNKT